MTDNDKPNLCKAFAVRVDEDVKARIEAMAAVEKRTLGNMVRRLIDEALKTQSTATLQFYNLGKLDCTIDVHGPGVTELPLATPLTVDHLTINITHE